MPVPRIYPDRCACSICGTAPPISVSKGWCRNCWRVYIAERRAGCSTKGFAVRRRAMLSALGLTPFISQTD